MAPAEVTADYYAVLEIPTNATLEVINKKYRRLALLRHPDRNPHSVNSTAIFQLLQNAHETLSCPTQRQLYDLQYPAIKARNADTQRRANAAQAAHERATASAATLRTLHTELKRQYDQLFECNRALHRLEAEVKRLRELDAQEERKEKARNSWWSYLSAPLYGKAAGGQAESAQQKLVRETERLQRGASRRIKESEVAKREKEVGGLLSRIDQVKRRIEAEKKRVEEEEATFEGERRAKMREEERERQKREMQEMQEKWMRAEEERERQRREVKEMQEKRMRAEAMRKQRELEERQRQQKEAQEHLRKLQRESRERQEKEEASRVRKREEHLQWAEAARQRARESGVGAQRHGRGQRAGTNGTNACTHQKFWVKVEGRQLCSECNIVQRRFAFRCPGCSKIACAGCRKKLRDEGQRPFRGGARFETGGYDHDEDFDLFGY